MIRNRVMLRGLDFFRFESLGRVLLLSSHKAIYSTLELHQTSNISVIDSDFLFCNTMHEKGGGAILSLGSTTNFHIKSCSFYQCSCSKSFSSGGAVNIADGSADVRIIKSCFLECSASLAGHAFLIRSEYFFSVINESTTSSSPYYQTKQCLSPISISSDIMIQSCNISRSKAIQTPSFRIFWYRIITMHFISVSNCTCSTLSSVYDISHQRDDTIIHSVADWNIHNCKGEIIAIGYYSSTSLRQIRLSVSKCTDPIKMLSDNCIVIFENCIWDSAFDSSNYDQNGKIQTNNCFLIKKKHFPSFKIQNAYVSRCWEIRNNGPVHRFSEVAKNQMYLPFIIIIIGVLSMMIIGNVINHISQRRERIYEELAIPEIEK